MKCEFNYSLWNTAKLTEWPMFRDFVYRFH